MTTTLLLVLTYLGVASSDRLGAVVFRVPLVLARAFSAVLKRTAPASEAEVQLAADLRRTDAGPFPNQRRERSARGE
jgi:hypothetical protein